MTRYYAVQKKNRLRLLPKGTKIQRESPDESHGGYNRDHRLYVYYLDLNPDEHVVNGSTTRLTVDLASQRIKKIEPLLTSNELEELDREEEERDSWDC